MNETEFYNHLNLVSQRVQKERFRHRLRWFLEKEGFSKSEVNAIEYGIKFTKRSKV